MNSYGYHVKLSNKNYIKFLYTTETKEEVECTDMKDAFMFYSPDLIERDSYLKNYLSKNNLTYTLVKLKAVITYEVIE